MLPNTSALDHGLEVQTPFAWLIPPHLHTFLGFGRILWALLGMGEKSSNPAATQSSTSSLPWSAAVPQHPCQMAQPSCASQTASIKGQPLASSVS